MKWLTLLVIAGVLVTSPALADGFYFGFDVGPMSFRFGNDYWYGNEWYDYADQDVDFEGYLQGYGYWVYLPTLGRVWIPYVEFEWRPYYNGHWSWTSYGWTWIAYEPWGWIPHHFGRWVWDLSYGWIWIPGYEWGPAWVTWRSWGTHVAWAPMPPADFHYHHHDHYYDNRERWEGHRRPSRIALPYELSSYEGWTCVGRQEFSSENIPSVAADLEMASRSFEKEGAARILTEQPTRQDVERWTNNRVSEVSVSVARTKMGGKTVTMVRPKNQLDKVNRYAPSVEKKYIQPAISRSKGKRVDEAGRSSSTDSDRRIINDRSSASEKLDGRTSRPYDEKISNDSDQRGYTGRDRSLTRKPVPPPTNDQRPQIEPQKRAPNQPVVRPRPESSHDRNKPAELRPRSAPNSSKQDDSAKIQDKKSENEKETVKKGQKKNEKTDDQSIDEKEKKTDNPLKIRS